MVERATIGEAADALSNRIRQEAVELAAELGEPRPDSPEAEPLAGAEAMPSEEEATAGVEEATESVEEDVERFELPQGVNELAEMLGVEPDALYGLKVNVNLGDESRAMTLEELKAAATGPARDEAERARWNDHKRAQEAELQAQANALAERRREADTLATVVFSSLDQKEKQISAHYSNLLSNTEYQSRDPNGYQVELLRARAAMEDVQRQKHGLMAQMDQMRSQMAEEERSRLAEMEVAGRRRLRELVPEWADDEGFSTGAAELQAYVMQERFGTTKEELEKTLDPRILYWAEMARRYEALQEKARSVPKIQPKSSIVPGTQQRVRLPSGRRAEIEAMERLKGSGSINDARSVLSNRLKQLGG